MEFLIIAIGHNWQLVPRPKEAQAAAQAQFERLLAETIAKRGGI
jgi:hypothetical protein